MDVQAVSVAGPANHSIQIEPKVHHNFARRIIEMSKVSDVQPRVLSERQAAAYWNVCPNTFRKLVALGIAPKPINIPELGRNLYDREQQDAAIEARRELAQKVA